MTPPNFNTDGASLFSPCASTTPGRYRYRCTSPLAESELPSYFLNEPITRENVIARLNWLSQAYSQAKTHNKVGLAEKYLALAAVHVRFIVKAEIPITPNIKAMLTSMDIYLPQETDKRGGIRSGVSKAIHIAGLLVSSPGSTIDKIVANTSDDSGIGDASLGGVSAAHKAKDGLEVRVIYGWDGTYANGTKKYVPIGKIISPTNDGVIAGFTVQETNDDAGKERRYLAFSSATGFTGYSDDAHPAALSIVDGIHSNGYLSPSMDGIVVIENGKVKIYNVNKTEMAERIARALLSNQSAFQSNLLVDRGENIVSPESSGKRDQRRILATFMDGTSAIIQLDPYLSLYEAAQIIRNIPGINNAVNLDTGGGNVGGYAGGENWQYFSSGHTAHTVFYYKIQ
jgi:hypothetical protein